MKDTLTVKHLVEVDFKFGELGAVLEWCRENCAGEWDVEVLTRYHFKFTDENDAAMFILRWT